MAACSGSGGAEPAVTVPASPPTTAAPAPAEPPRAPVAEYLFPQNHPGRHGLAGRKRVEQLLSAGERTVAVVADTSFQPAVGFRCIVTVNVDGSQASVNGFVAVGDDYWLDTGLGWERVPPERA